MVPLAIKDTVFMETFNTILSFNGRWYQEVVTNLPDVVTDLPEVVTDLPEAVSDLPEVSTDLSVLFTDHPEAWILKMKLDNSSAALFLNTLKVSNNLGC